jgi:hypothetical protein
LKVDERFGDVKSLKNPRCGYLTKRNMDGDLFEEIVKVLKRK